jgi:hypothetical protein
MRGVRLFEHVNSTSGTVDEGLLEDSLIANLLLCINSRSNVQRCNIPTTPVKIVSKCIKRVGKLYLQRVKWFSTKTFSLVNNCWQHCRLAIPYSVVI